MGSAPDAVKRLIEHFERDRKVFLSHDYKEEQLRAEFLNLFFTALGWDMDNNQGLSKTFKPVLHEESVRSRGNDSVAVTAPRRGCTPTFDGPQTMKPSLMSLTSMLISC
jgi:hypothetical protein